MANNTIGHKLRKLREEKNLTYQEAAALCGVSIGSTWGIENQSDRAPTFRTLKKIANGFNVPMEYFSEKFNNSIYARRQNYHYESKFNKLTSKDRTRILKIMDLWLKESH